MGQESNSEPDLWLNLAVRQAVTGRECHHPVPHHQQQQRKPTCTQMLQQLAVSAFAGFIAAAAAATLLVLRPDLLSAADRSDWRPFAVNEQQAATVNGSSALPRIRLAHMGRHYVVVDEAQQESRRVSLTWQ